MLLIKDTVKSTFTPNEKVIPDISNKQIADIEPNFEYKLLMSGCSRGVRE